MIEQKEFSGDQMVMQAGLLWEAEKKRLAPIGLLVDGHQSAEAEFHQGKCPCGSQSQIAKRSD